MSLFLEFTLLALLHSVSHSNLNDFPIAASGCSHAFYESHPFKIGQLLLYSIFRYAYPFSDVFPACMRGFFYYFKDSFLGTVRCFLGTFMGITLSYLGTISGYLGTFLGTVRWFLGSITFLYAVFRGSAPDRDLKLVCRLLVVEVDADILTHHTLDARTKSTVDHGSGGKACHQGVALTRDAQLDVVYLETAIQASGIDDF